MKKKTGSKRLNEKDRASVIVPVRITVGEDKLLKKLAKIQGESYVTRVVRRLIQEAIRPKESLVEKVCNRD